MLRTWWALRPYRTYATGLINNGCRCAEKIAEAIIQTYQEPNRALHELIAYVRQGHMNFLVEFSEAARSDLARRA